MLALRGLAKPACRQHTVVDDESVIVDEQDVDARFHVAMLEGIVEQDDVDVVGCLVSGEVVDAIATFLVYRHIGFGELPHHLEGLVANVGHRGVGISENISLRLPLIASREHRHLYLVLH